MPFIIILKFAKTRCIHSLAVVPWPSFPMVENAMTGDERGRRDKWEKDIGQTGKKGQVGKGYRSQLCNGCEVMSQTVGTRSWICGLGEEGEVGTRRGGREENRREEGGRERDGERL
jgi:hypothetical protein